MAKNFMRCAIDADKLWMLDDYASDPIDLCPSLVEKWLTTQKPNVAAQAYSETPIEHREFQRFSYMVKSDLKPPLDRTAVHEYASVQTIAYNSKDVNLVFCAVLPELRDRIFRVLRPNLKIYSGMSPSDFMEMMNSQFDAERLGECYTVENDMRKYDKSQDAAVLQFECSVMRAFGVAEHLVELWYNSHAQSSLVDKMNGVTARVKFQRKSGDASTFLGNTLYVMAVILATYDVDDIVCGLFAGDDSLLYMRSLCSALVDNSDRLANMFNLECKLLTGYKFPSFCSKFLIHEGPTMQLVPDPVKCLSKLGRRDLRNPDHVEEYRVSMQDNMQYLSNERWYGVLSMAINERYKTSVEDFTPFFRTLNTVMNDSKAFASLYVEPERSRMLYDPTRTKFTKPSKARTHNLYCDALSVSEL